MDIEVAGRLPSLLSETLAVNDSPFAIDDVLRLNALMARSVFGSALASSRSPKATSNRIGASPSFRQTGLDSIGALHVVKTLIPRQVLLTVPSRGLAFSGWVFVVSRAGGTQLGCQMCDDYVMLRQIRTFRWSEVADYVQWTTVCWHECSLSNTTARSAGFPSTLCRQRFLDGVRHANRGARMASDLRLAGTFPGTAGIAGLTGARKSARIKARADSSTGRAQPLQG